MPTLTSVADQNYSRFAGPTALIELRNFLTAAQETHKGLIRTARASARNRDGILLANTEGNSRASRRNSSFGTRNFLGNSRLDDDINIGGNDSDSSSSGTGTGLPGGRNHDSTLGRTEDDPEFDAINPVDMKPGRYAQLTQPAQITKSLPKGSSYGMRSSQLLRSLFCHLCFEEGHIKPNCPYLPYATDLQYLAYFQ